MKVLRHIYEVIIKNEEGHNILNNNGIISAIADSICSWDFGNSNDDMTQWNECIFNNVGLIATDGISSKSNEEIINDMIYILEDNGIECNGLKINLTRHDLDLRDFIVDKREGTCLYDYTDMIIENYKRIK